MDLFDNEKIGKFIRKNGILLAGVLIFAAILFVFLLPKTESSDNTGVSTEAFIQKTEGRLKELLSSVDGVGNVRVMITLKDGGEYIYATEVKKEENTSSEESEEKSYSECSERTEETYKLVSSSGSDAPLLIKVKEPEISGIVIVCSGGGSASVRLSVLNAVSALFGIPSSKVTVLKMS